MPVREHDEVRTSMQMLRGTGQVAINHQKKSYLFPRPLQLLRHHESNDTAEADAADIVGSVRLYLSNLLDVRGRHVGKLFVRRLAPIQAVRLKTVELIL